MGQGGGTVSLGGRVPPWCQIILWWIPQVGCWGTALLIHSSTDVCTCHQICAERSREINSLWLPAGPPKSGSQGRHIHCPPGRVPDVQQRKWGPLPPGICAEKVAWTPTVWARKSMADRKGHHFFLERLPKVEGGGTARRRWRARVCQHLSPLPLQMGFTERKVGQLRGAITCQGQGSPLVGAGGCHCTGGMHQKIQLIHH